MVFQNYALFPHLSVADNIVFGLVVRGASRQGAGRAPRPACCPCSAWRIARPQAIATVRRPAATRRPARALVADSGICLMDEPLSNLDAQLRQEMRQELRALQQNSA